MKRVFVLASVLSAMCLFAGCGDNVQSSEAHVCTHFYDNVNSAAKQTPVALEAYESTDLPDEHVLYALTLGGYFTENGISFRGEIKIPVYEEGTLIVTTSNFEDDFGIEYNGMSLDPLLNAECDVNSYQFYANSAKEYVITVLSSKPQVLLTYEFVAK